MYKISVLLLLSFLGALAFPKNRDVEETKGMAHIVMCACDDDSSGAISHEEFNSDVCQAIVHFEVSQEDFDNCDTNGDGEVDLDEALAAIEADENEPMSRALTVFNRANFLSNDAHVEAIGRVMDCVCDQDGGPNCEGLRYLIEQGQELASVLEAYWRGPTSRMNGDQDTTSDTQTKNATAYMNMIFVWNGNMVFNGSKN